MTISEVHAEEGKKPREFMYYEEGWDGIIRRCALCNLTRANVVTIEISNIPSVGNIYICRECFLRFADFVRNIE